MKRKSVKTRTVPKNRCYFCYEALGSGDIDYHPTCARKLFPGHSTPPTVEVGMDDIQNFAKEVVNQRLVVTGVQRKLSLGMEREGPGSTRLTIVGWNSHYILKPPHEKFPELPEIEDLCMHFSEICKIKTARHGLVPLKTGELAYISKRFDRPKKKKKLPVEDLCQLMGFLTEDKYQGSMEKVGKIIRKYSSNPGVDAVTFFDLALLCFLIGNADMHLKNFSLLTDEQDFVSLAPAYDLVSTALVMPRDNEESALPLNGKKSNLTRKDFIALGENLDLPEKVIEKSFARMGSNVEPMLNLIPQSFLSKEMQKKFESLFQERADRLTL
ncbi:MAG: type II toxin-antitoxin system HipA family toxin [Bradymonadales bacterium]|nr:MAG: type II toxin-antitoxin system HipA family toxin [Bradymonadales bacterium]